MVVLHTKFNEFNNVKQIYFLCNLNLQLNKLQNTFKSRSCKNTGRKASGRNFTYRLFPLINLYQNYGSDVVRFPGAVAQSD